MLKVAVTGGDETAVLAAVDRLRELAAEGGRVTVAPSRAPDPGAYHLVLGVGRTSGDARVDAWVPDPADSLDELWEGRIAPFAANLARRRRAPRRQQVVLFAPDPAWAVQAARLMARLAPVVGDRARRMDHIGSTSVPGMIAKDIIDLQVVVDDLDTATEAAAASREAGFVHVVAPLYGIDRHGAHHEEQVAVDADPGRPVNVHFHPVSSPIWREMLLLRDWLRADEGHRNEYAAMKRGLATRLDRDVNDYSVDKMPWIGDALGRAEVWARRERPTP